MARQTVEYLGANGAFYTVYVKEIHEDFLTAVYPEGHGVITLPFSSVRLPPPTNDNKDIGVGEMVEVYCRASELEACGWWLARVVVVVGEQYLVEFKAFGPLYNVTVSGEYIRRYHPNSALKTFRMFRMSVPEELREISSTKKFQVEVKTAIGADLILYNSQMLMFVGLISTELTTGATVQERTALQSNKQHATKMLVAATTPKLVSKEVVKTAATVERAGLQSDRGNAAKRLEVATCHKQAYEEIVKVKKTFMRDAIRYHTTNLQKAKQVPGVTAVIQAKGSYFVKICGVTGEAVKQARSHLEYKEEFVQVPRNLEGKIKQVVIKEIVLKSGVWDVGSVGDLEDNTPRMRGMAPFYILGSWDSIPKAAALLQEHVSYLEEMEKCERTEESSSVGPNPQRADEERTSLHTSQKHKGHSKEHSEPGTIADYVAHPEHLWKPR